MTISKIEKQRNIRDANEMSNVNGSIESSDRLDSDDRSTHAQYAHREVIENRNIIE